MTEALGFSGTSHLTTRTTSASIIVRINYESVFPPISDTMCNSIVVFNTEAHPFQAPRAKPVYGTPNGGIQYPTKPFSIQKGAPLPAISPNAKLPLTLKVPSQ